MKIEKNTGAEPRCIVCGRKTYSGGGLCDCCRESLALCDVENYVARKTERKIYRGGGLNAFK